MFFPYGEAEISHLKARDRRLSAAIDRIGRIEREVRPELFSALVHSIVGQQISTRAQETVWGRISGRLGAVTPQTVLALPPEERNLSASRFGRFPISAMQPKRL